MTTRSEARAERHGVVFAGIHITHPDRIYFPEAALSKGAVAAYYEMVAPRLLMHAADRPMSLLRCPEGRQAECFFQKHPGKGFPAAIRIIAIEQKDGRSDAYMYLSGPASVLGAVQLGALEFHVWGARRDRLDRPDRMVFDLDPDEGLGFDHVKRAALDIRDDLAGIGLVSAALVTGGKGVHVIVPLRRTAGWGMVKTFAQTFTTVLSRRQPARFTATMSKEKRKGRIFIDWLRNERGATAIAPYSLRARAGAPVAVPVDWAELENLSAANAFGIGDIRQRMDRPCPLAEPKLQTLGAKTMAALECWAGSD